MALFSILTLLLISFLATSCRAAYYLSLQDWSSNLILNYGWAYDGEVGHAFKNPTDAAGLVPFYQLRYPASGFYQDLLYFYTRDENEKNSFLANPDWVVDDTWYVYGSPVAGSQPLHRLYQAATSDHIWTTSDAETMQLQTPAGGSWGDEGPVCWLPPAPPPPFPSDGPPFVGVRPEPMSRYHLVARPPTLYVYFI